MNFVFDIDDTLYDLMEPFEKAHQEVFAPQTEADCEALFMASRVYSDEAFYMHEKGLISPKEEFAYRIRKTYADVGLAVTEEEIERFEACYRCHQKRIAVPSGIRTILEWCRQQGIMIAALTNGKHRNQQKKIDALQLETYFAPEHIFISEDIGYTKPDARAFLAVQNALQLNPEETWFIGDTYEVDVTGAGRAGWHVIWFNHRRRPLPEGELPAEKEVRNAAELLDLIRELAR